IWPPSTVFATARRQRGGAIRADGDAAAVDRTRFRGRPTPEPLCGGATQHAAPPCFARYEGVDGGEPGCGAPRAGYLLGPCWPAWQKPSSLLPVVRSGRLTRAPRGGGWMMRTRLATPAALVAVAALTLAASAGAIGGAKRGTRLNGAEEWRG